jgi:hypothetical protein
MPPAPKRYDLNLNALTDEELIDWFRECDFRLAYDTLVQSYQARICRRIAWLARQKGLPEHEWPDAQQAALTNTLPGVVERYGRNHEGRLAKFPTLLDLAIDRRFTNYLRHRRREEKHLDRKVYLDGDRITDRPHMQGRSASSQAQQWLADREPGPNVAAEAREERERLRAVWNRWSGCCGSYSQRIPASPRQPVG